MTTEVRGRDEIQSILQRADSLLEVNRPREALPLLQDALRLNPENLHALASTARVHLALNDVPNALKFAEEAIRAEPQREWGHRLRSIVLQQSGKSEEALAAAQTAASLAPDNTLVLMQLFSALRGLKRKEDAWRVAHRMVELAPQLSASHINVGLAYLDYSMLDDAEAAFRRALQIDPESWAAMNNVGVVLQRKNRTSEAVEFYYRAAQLNPELPLPRSNLFKTGMKYLSGPATGISVLLVFVTAIAVKGLDMNDDQSAITIWSAIALAVLISILGRRLRMRQLGEPLQRVLTDEQRRRRRQTAHRGFMIAMVVFGLVCWLPSFLAPFSVGAAGIAMCCGASVVQTILWAFWWRTRTPGL